MSLFRLIAKLGIDATDFDAGLKKAESGMKSSMSSMANHVAGAFSVAAIAAYTNHVVHLVGNIKDLAEQLDLTNEQVQILNRVSAGSGVAVEKYASALAKIKKLQADLVAGDLNAAVLAGRLGIGQSDDAFDILKKLGFSEDKAAVIDLLGVKSVNLLNSLKDIESIGPMLIISNEQVDLIDKAAKRAESLRMDAEAYFAIKGAEAMSEYEKGHKALGGKGYAGPLAGLSAVYGAILDYIGDAFGFDGPSKKYMGRLDLEEALKKRKESRESSVRDLPVGYGNETTAGNPVERMMYKSGSPRIDMGDRSKVGGFFGPNADLNRNMQRSLDVIAKDIAKIRERISSVVHDN